MQKTPIFITFSGKKRSNWKELKKKTVAGINCRLWPIFPNITHLTHFYIWGVKCYGHFFFFTFSGKNRSNNKIFGKKNLRASTRTHDPFFDNSGIWPTFIYRGEVPAHTFAKIPVHALINDSKKLFQKKVYVTIPQWFETFPNVSDLWSGRNRAKCGLVLNDPIDWFKLRLNQPKIYISASERFHSLKIQL